jgi:NDP-sugar pyrophosphorylase family protein/aminoglycoside/choline kinase family phosphotransferase
MNHSKITQNLTAFILAAGLGERLLPITQHIPKPLLPILGKPVLESILEKITALSIHTIGINLHHKKHTIENWITDSEYRKNITLFPEDPILGTGGALKNAEGFLNRTPFLVHNADIISTIDLGELIELHISSGDLATLAVHNHPEFNRLEVNGSGQVTGFISCRKWLEGGWRPVAFTGIAMYQPEFLQFLLEGNSSVVDAWFRALSAGHRIGTKDVSGCYWTDIGTPSSYARAVVQALREDGENIYIHQSAKGCMHAELDGYVVIEKDNTFNQCVALRNCISLPGTAIGKTSSDQSSPECFLTLFWGTHHDRNNKGVFGNSILGPDTTVTLSESDFYDTDAHGNSLIGTGGSDRKYYRIKHNDHTAVLMKCTENDPDFDRHIEYTTFFRTHEVPVPTLITAEPETKTAFFEDLGDLSLYSWLKCPRLSEEVEEMYRRVLDILIAIHTTATTHLHQCPLLNDRVFDYEYLRWETTYFFEQFVEGLQNRKIESASALNDEFHQLAFMVDSYPKTIVHRDFQSQNIMVTKGGIPRILDYQGARIGPPAYDVVSLLWDPYFRLEDSLRDKLLNYYVSRVYEGISFESEFRKTLIPCRLQRHMQALGAYGFLSSVKGKHYFLKHVPEGLRLLREDISLAKKDYPLLYELVTVFLT